MSINNSGDFVAIIETATNKQVFIGNLLGQNNKVIIGVIPTHLADPTAHLASNHDEIKNLSHPLYVDFLEVWLDYNPQYVEFDAKKHTVKVIRENTTPFKAYATNDVYNFRSNRWGERTLSGKFWNPIDMIDNPLKPMENVTLRSTGGENAYFVVNDLECAVKYPNIKGFMGEIKKPEIGVYDLVQDPSNPEMLLPVLVHSYEKEYRANLIAEHAKLQKEAA